MHPPDFSTSILPFNQFFDVDWVWNHSMVDYMENDIDLDGLQVPEQRPNDPLSDADPQSSTSDPSPPTLLNDDESTDDEDQCVVTNELSHRLGSLLMTDNGERHFYGATSNLHLARGGNLPVMCANRSDKGQKAQARLEAAGLDEDMGRNLEDHLVQLFFAWHNPSLYIVDEAIFTKARQDFQQGKQDTMFYSPFLMNAMFDFGLHVSTKAYVEAGSMSAEEARGRSVAFWGSYATDQYVPTSMEQHSLSQVNILVVQITFSAALILVYATVSERDIENHRRLTGHLEMCCRALAELGHVFNNAARTLDVLLHVKRTWQARLVAASAGSKRRASFAAGSPTKRRTMSDVTRV
ncbi:hypothetical protein SLS63_007305 [Diaporthe eres]|uniref:Transcription factor domain-containing protein n=1 Tax=Diaporthe eres TaxID=83184 RepID=A0ABR1P5Z3_DIAER